MINSAYKKLQKTCFTKKGASRQNQIINQLVGSLKFFALEKLKDDKDDWSYLMGYKSFLPDPLSAISLLQRYSRVIPSEGDPVFLLIMLTLLASENPLSVAAAKGQDIDPLVLAVAKQELDVLETIARLGSRKLYQLNSFENGLPPLDFKGVVSLRPDSRHRIISGFEEMAELFTQPLPWSQRTDDLIKWYRRYGCGACVYQYAFEFEGTSIIESTAKLIPIADIDLPASEDFFCYDEQRQVVRENTERFVSGRPAQDLLLYGDRGTGKSSTVRLMLNEFADRGLRLIRTSAKTDTIRELLRFVKDQRWKYVLFIDDISFNSFGSGALEFRSLLQGDVMERPKNVLFYVTSNRRTIIRTKTSDTDDNDPVNTAEDQQEILALSDRFGIKVWYPTPSQDEYLSIVHGLVAQKGITLPVEEIKRRALLWERWRNGRSPRTAEQFVRSLVAECSD